MITHKNIKHRQVDIVSNKDFPQMQFCNSKFLQFLSPLLNKHNLLLNEGKIYEKIINVSDELMNKVIGMYGSYPISTILLTTILIYFYRINNYESFSVFFSNLSRDQQIINDELLLVANSVLDIDFQETEKFINALDYIVQKISFHSNRNHQDTWVFDQKELLENPSITSCLVIITNKDLEEFRLPTICKFAIVISEDKAKFKLFSNVSIFNDSNLLHIVNSMPLHIFQLLNSSVDFNDNKLENLPILPVTEYKKLVATYNATQVEYDKEKTIVDMFETQVNVAPNQTAIIYKGQHLTYDELNLRSNLLAYRLQKESISADTPIAICVERGFEVMIGVLGILKVGGAYVPLDGEYPIDRLKLVLQDSRAPLLLTQSHLAKKFVNYSGNIILLDQYLNSASESVANPLKKVKSSNLAYIIYTSGTTGVPKGVAITHGSVTNHMVWMKNCFAFNQSDLILQKTTLSFDASVWELFIPLITGGKLVFADQGAHKDPKSLIKLINRYNITTLQLVPSMLREFLKQEKVESCKSLRHVFVGGELLSADIRKLFFQKFSINLYNLYGPTETTIECTFHKCQNSDIDFSVNSIGKPINNTKVYVLDSRMQVVPIGIPGQLFVGGDCVAKEYLNNEELTTKKFIVDGFSSDSNSKLYKTGDLVRWLPNGDLEYLNRLNDQVKIRGFRVELNDIEAHLLEHVMIKQCALVIENGDFGQPHLVAYLVLSNKKDLNVTKLRNFLKQSLPEYMVPDIFKIIDELPFTPNGKIDKKALVKTKTTAMSLGKKYLSPSSEVELILTEVWRKVLKVDKIGVNDDFFDLGGNSLVALQVISIISKKLGVNLNLRAFYELPTIAGLSLEISEMKNCVHGKNKSVAIPSTRFLNSIPSPVITLQAEGEKTPIFLIHPVGGTIFWYMLLAKYLGTQRPVYGIQDPGVELDEPLFSSIEEIAELYLKFIKEVQPTGPYIIGGASFGSTVAIEVSRALRKQNESIYFIPVLDGWAFYPDKLRDDNYFRDTMNRQHEVLRTHFVNKEIENTEALFNLQWSRLSLLWKYKMQPIEDKIVLFKSKELLSVFATIESPLNYWDIYARQEVDLHIIPGDHETMFYEPHVKILAQKLNMTFKQFAD